jgi:lambda repressor-like predicted transcriptional regulator
MEKDQHTEESFHLGKMIKAELARQGRSITWLAKQIDCTRENLYQHFRSPWIHTHTLFKISKALDCDFFKVCSDYYNSNREKEN